MALVHLFLIPASTPVRTIGDIYDRTDPTEPLHETVVGAPKPAWEGELVPGPYRYDFRVTEGQGAFGVQVRNLGSKRDEPGEPEQFLATGDDAGLVYRFLVQE